MSPSKVLSVRRSGGSADHASRTKIFGPDANSDTLVCGSCRYGAKEDWTPTMKKSQCPACGNREGHKVKADENKETDTLFYSLFFKTGSPESQDELKELVNSGWEMAGRAPFSMGLDHNARRHGKGITKVHEYFIMLRKFV